MIQVFLNLFQLVPVFLYTYRYKPKDVQFWRILLILKIIFDATGNSYQIFEILAIYHANPLHCVLYTILTIAIYIPAYMVWYLYAFQTDMIFAKQKVKNK